MVNADSTIVLTPQAPSMWPTLAETVRAKNEKDAFDWEFVSSDQVEDACKSMGRCVSSPNLGDYVYFDYSTVSSSSNDTDINATGSQANESVVVVPALKPTPTEKMVKVRRVPSFKDAILLNAEEKEKEKESIKKKEAKAIETARNRRRTTKPKFVVKPIEKRSLSTNDLKSLVSICENEDDDYYGGGGGGGPICENSVIGDSDACEFYERKNHGHKTHRNGLKLRPDEAKRKEMIMFKKDAQRQNQKAKQK